MPMNSWPEQLTNFMSQRVFRYADRLSRILFILAFGLSIAAGATLPLMTIIFGQFTKKFTNFTTGGGSVSEFQGAVNTLVLYFVYLFVARFAITYIANVCVGTAAIRTTSSLRYAFLEATLRQEIWHFDMEDNGSISSQVTTSKYKGHETAVAHD